MTAGKKARIVITGIIVVLIIIFAIRFISMRGRTPARSIDEIQAAEGIPVDISIVKRGSINRYLRLLGDVQGYEQVEIVSPLAIDVTEILKREGEQVKKGEVLIRLARDRRGNAYHQFAMAREAMENARRDVKRMENLYKEGAVSAQVLEQVRLNYRNAMAQYTQALSMVDLVTPISGIVTRVNATEGTAADPGVPLMTVAAADRVRIRCYVGQNEIGLLESGQKAFVCLSSPGKGGAEQDKETCEVEGRISIVSLSADSETKLFMAEIVADNSEGKLKPGLVAAVSVLVQKEEGVITVPRDALIRRERGDFVYLVKKGKASMTLVGLGVSNGEEVAVTGNVFEGDTLVIRGQFKLADRAKVRIHATIAGDQD